MSSFDDQCPDPVVSLAVNILNRERIDGQHDYQRSYTDTWKITLEQFVNTKNNLEIYFTDVVEVHLQGLNI
ncbi:9011_t:CDS:2 [Entrophospora sp. SA101]|nr:9011_t:CDS:2 [Entrophospora sp. SA101]